MWKIVGIAFAVALAFSVVEAYQPGAQLQALLP